MLRYAQFERANKNGYDIANELTGLRINMDWEEDSESTATSF